MIEDARNWINNNSAAATVVVVVILLISVATMVLRGRRPGVEPADAWFYDTVTGTEFTASAMNLPPIKSPDGNEAVKAHYYSCGPCTESGRFLGYYEKYSPETKKQIEDNREMLMFAPGAIPGHFFSADGKTWHADGSKEADAIINAIYEKCADVRSCLPDDIKSGE